jgi:hypothetical protein
MSVNKLTQNDGKSLPYKTKYHTTIENCQMMVDLFKKGIKMLTDISCPYNEITIWTFYMAMAINRLHESYRYLQLDDPEKMLHLTKQVIHLLVFLNRESASRLLYLLLHNMCPMYAYDRALYNT